MASEDQQLQIVIKAIDEASATLKNIASNSNAAANQVKQGADTAGLSFSKLVGGILTSQIAFAALSRAYEGVKEFFSQSIEQAIQAGDVMAQLQVQVRNAGMSYDELGPKIEATAQRNMMLGFADDSTKASLGKLILATHDFNDALVLNNLAMDLSASKHISLEEATSAVLQVMLGNTRVMKAYGISLDDAKTSAEALSIMHAALKNSASAAADSVGGQWRIVQAQWHEFQQEVGTALIPDLERLFAIFEKNLPTIEAVSHSLVDMIDKLGVAANVIAAPFRIAGNTIGNLLNVMQGLEWQDLSLQEAFTGTDGTTKSLSETFGTMADKVDDTGDSFSHISNKIQRTGTDLAQLATDFKEKMYTIGESVSATNDKITDLLQSYKQTQLDDTQKVAEEIVASEQKIFDLKRQINNTATGDEARRLDIELNQEQLNYASSLQFRQDHVKEIAIAEDEAKKTDLQRTLEQYNQKETLDQLNYQKKVTQLEQELKDEALQAAKEIAAYRKKTVDENAIIDTGTVHFQEQSNARVATVTNEVNAEVAQFSRLSSAIAGASIGLSLPSPSIVPRLHLASGGVVTGPTTALIGEAGPEAVIPLNRAGGIGGTSINITITGNKISSDMELRDVADEFQRRVIETLRMNQRVSV